MIHASEALAPYGLAYLASAYSAYPRGGIYHAYRDICKVGGELFKAGVRFISPIAHGHSLSVHGGVPPLSHDLWMPFDEALMHKCDALVVAMLEGWNTSKGVAHEMEFFRAQKKPVFRLDPISLVCHKE